MKLKNTVLLSILTLCGAVFAQTKAPEPDYTLSFNAGLTSDYRYRGISQSRLKPALQGGADFAHKSGFYVGTWASTIRWLEDMPGGRGPVEWDLYGGYKGEIAKDLSYDVGYLRYQYPRENFRPSVNTDELYGAVSFGPATLKYSHAVSNLFGFANSKNSGYLDLSASFDLGSGWSLVPHLGHQRVKNNSSFSYTDYALALNKDIDGLVLSAALVGTDVKTYVASNGKNLGRDGLVLSVKKNF
ncbi:MAG: TorF family putative porin [Burkholderiaceae bacterium]